MVKGKRIIALGLAGAMNFLPSNLFNIKIPTYNSYDAIYDLDNYMSDLQGEKAFDRYFANNKSKDYMDYKLMLFDYLDMLRTLGGDRQDKIRKCKEYLSNNYSSAMESIDKSIALKIDPNLPGLKKRMIQRLKEENISVSYEKAL